MNNFSFIEKHLRSLPYLPLFLMNGHIAAKGKRASMKLIKLKLHTHKSLKMSKKFKQDMEKKCKKNSQKI